MRDTLLKWPGGKQWIVNVLSPTIKKFNEAPLIELFAGGAALSMTLKPKTAILNDKNSHLINFYKQIQNGIDIFSLEIKFENDKEIFNQNRDRFNDLISKDINSSETAALFYFLNKTGFNGLMRFNSKGFFNVPFGRYKKINYNFDVDFYRNLFSKWSFFNEDFADVKIPKDAFVYADPPYDVPFTNYNADGFGWDDQIRLTEYLCKLSNPIILSNQATSRIIELYKSHGFYIDLIDAPRFISCNGDRKKAREVIAYKNIPEKYINCNKTINIFERSM